MSIEWTAPVQAKAQEIALYEHAVMVHGNAAKYLDRLGDKAAASKVRTRAERTLQLLQEARLELARLTARPTRAI